jgi:hypothetical protein
MGPGRSLKWDANQRRVAGDEEANHRLARQYRGDWKRLMPENV